MATFRGLETKHERGASQMARDTRPMGERVAEFLADPTHAVVMVGTMGATMIFEPMGADLYFLIALGFFMFAFFRKTVLPIKMPRSAKAMDYNDCIPGTGTPRKSSGISFIANEHNTGKEVWLSNDDMRTHMLIFGSTGSGKTEALVSIAFNSLVQGSGFIYIDGKGDNSLYAKIFSMVRRMGRDDDLLLINFMTGARDVIGPQKTRLSNTMNPFSLGSSSMLSQLIISLMDSGSGGGDGDMWKGRAMGFVESLMKILTVMRDEGHILLDANSIRNYFALEKLEMIVVDKRFPINDTDSVPLDNLPPIILEPMNNYVINLPGYNKSKKGNQASEVREQHGFITMQLTRVFGSLADTYGHIIRTNLAEVDFKDVVLNRRIMVVLLPALEKSPEELSNLGKIIIASLKGMMAAGLGDEVEGSYRDVIQRKPTTSPTPFVCIMDEYGYYAVKGFAVVPAQARSLGFSAIFAGQDLPAFQKAGKEEAASIGANTNIKICMKLEDPTDTWEFFNKTAGETFATSVQSFQVGAGSMTNNYMDSKTANVERRSRIDLMDLKDQREGDAHIFFRSKIIRARMFYANPKPAQYMQVNQYLCVDKPDESELFSLDKRLRRFNQIFNDPAFVMETPPPSEEVALIALVQDQYSQLKPFERGIASVIAILEREVEKQRESQQRLEAEKTQAFTDEVHAFTSVYLPDVALAFVAEGDRDKFKQPLLLQSRTKELVMHIERLAGKTEPQAAEMADNLIRDIMTCTHYPPAVDFEANPAMIEEAIDDLIDNILGTNRRRIGKEAAEMADDE